VQINHNRYTSRPKRGNARKAWDLLITKRPSPIKSMWYWRDRVVPMWVAEFEDGDYYEVEGWLFSRTGDGNGGFKSVRPPR